MGTGLPRIVVLLFFFIAVITSYAWGEVRQVTILYSNNISGQIDPVG